MPDGWPPARPSIHPAPFRVLRSLASPGLQAWGSDSERGPPPRSASTPFCPYPGKKGCAPEGASGVLGLLEAQNNLVRQDLFARRSNGNTSDEKAFGTARWTVRRSFSSEISHSLYQAKRPCSAQQRGTVRPKGLTAPSYQHVFARSFPGSLFGAPWRGPSARGLQVLAGGPRPQLHSGRLGAAASSFLPSRLVLVSGRPFFVSS